MLVSRCRQGFIPIMSGFLPSPTVLAVGRAFELEHRQTRAGQRPLRTRSTTRCAKRSRNNVRTLWTCQPGLSCSTSLGHCHFLVCFPASSLRRRARYPETSHLTATKPSFNDDSNSHCDSRSLNFETIRVLCRSGHSGFGNDKADRLVFPDKSSNDVQSFYPVTIRSESLSTSVVGERVISRDSHGTITIKDGLARSFPRRPHDEPLNLSYFARFCERVY